MCRIINGINLSTIFSIGMGMGLIDTGWNGECNMYKCKGSIVGNELSSRVVEFLILERVKGSDVDDCWNAVLHLCLYWNVVEVNLDLALVDIK